MFNLFKKLLLNKYLLWKIIIENEEIRTYKHLFFNSVIHVQKENMFHSKKYHVDKFIIWYNKKK